jgi:hypothetical protein
MPQQDHAEAARAFTPPTQALPRVLQATARSVCRSVNAAPGTKVFLLLFLQKKKILLFLKKKKQNNFYSWCQVGSYCFLTCAA